MTYSFRVVECEDRMKNFFRNYTGRLIKDTILISLKNNGEKPWTKYKGYFKCREDKSNLFFETFQIPEDVYENETKEYILSFPRIKKNFNSGKMICTIQFVYKDTVYNEETIQFTKSFDITGNTVIRVRKEKEAEKIKKEEEERKKKEEELKKNLKAGDEIVEVEGGNDKMSNIIKKFRKLFGMKKEDYDDDYIKAILINSQYDFSNAFENLANSNEENTNEELLNDNNKLNELIVKFRENYGLSTQDFPDEVVEEALIDGNGDFHKAYAKLMTKGEDF